MAKLGGYYQVRSAYLAQKKKSVWSRKIERAGAKRDQDPLLGKKMRILVRSRAQKYEILRELPREEVAAIVVSIQR
jgi:hypothetical protein